MLATDDASAPKARVRVLVLTSTYPRWARDPEPGFVHELCSRLQSSCDVLVLGPHAPGAATREILDGVQVHRYRYAPARLETLVNDGGVVTNLRRHRWKWGLVPFFLLSQWWVARRLVRQWKPDVIHAHWLLPQGLLAILAGTVRGARVPVVVTSHGADLFALRAGPLQSLKRIVARRSAALTVVSAAMNDELARVAAEPQSVHIMPMGVDLESRFVPGDPTAVDRNELLFVGRLVEKKGVCHLLDALPAVIAELPDVRLTIAGFGPEAAALNAQVQRMGLDDRVAFVGAVSQSELPALYQRAGLFVAPFVTTDSGDQEGLGLVLVEALGCGCPVVTTRIPATRDVFGGGWPEHCADPGSSDSLARCIVATLREGDAARAHVASRRPTLRHRFGWASVAAGYAELLARAASRTSPRGDLP